MVSAEEKLRILGPAFMWLLNHYDPKDKLPPQVSQKVVAVAEQVLRDVGQPSVEDFTAFRRKYFDTV